MFTIDSRNRTTVEYIFDGIVKFFQFCGISPIEIIYTRPNRMVKFRESPVSNILTKLDIWLSLWSFSMLTPLIAYVAVIAYYYSEIMDMFGSLGKVNAGAKGAAIILTHLAVLYEALFTRVEQRQLWAKLLVVDECLASLGANATVARMRFFRDYSIKFGSYLIFALVSELLIFITVRNNSEWSVYWYATIFSLMVIRLKHLQHVLYVDMLTSRFHVIKLELERIASTSRKIMDYQLLDQVKGLQSAYATLYEMCDLLGAVCNISQLTNLTQNFIQLSGDLYWMYSMLHRNQFDEIPGGL